MTDKVIKVNVTATKKQSVNISSGNVQNQITATPDTSQYYGNLSRNWAIGEGLIQNEDYSSKHYANIAKESAENASNFENATRQTYNAFLDSSENANNELLATKEEALTAINDRFEEGIGDGIDQITVLVDNSIAEYTEISNQIKQENSEASKLAKDWATSEVLVDNIDYSAKYYAEKAKDNSGIFYDELTDEDIDVDILEQGYVSDIEFEEALATKQDKGDYALRSEIPSITHLATKNEVNAKQDKGDYATRIELSEGLDTKQDKGNYALKSEIPSITHLATKDELPTQVSALENDSNYATQTQVMQAIASIPQFKLSIVEALPATGEKMILYLVSKGGESPDVYDEYIWIKETSTFEFLGTTAVDLTDYVKNTDYAGDNAGVIKRSSTYGTAMYSGYLTAGESSLEQYKTRQNSYFIGKGTLENIKNDLVKRAVTANDIELTDDEKTSARTWIGAVGNTDYATTVKAGLIQASPYFGLNVDSSGAIHVSPYTVDQLNNKSEYTFISKGTLVNALTQYSKTVLTTEADYEALETKDANTLYLIEE